LDVVERDKLTLDFFRSLFDLNFSLLFESRDRIRLRDEDDDELDALLFSLLLQLLLLLLLLLTRLAGTTLVTIAISF
jgi:hypothetical protein